MKLSIIIICLNEEANLPRCLGAIRDARKGSIDLETIVVDGGSTDRSREIAESMGARVLGSPKGIPIQRNVGGRAATGDVIAFVDADVELTDRWFEEVSNLFNDDVRKLVGSAPRLPGDASWVARAYAMHWGLPYSEHDHAIITEDERLLSTQSLVLGKEIFDAVGGFPEHLGVDEDTYLVLRAKEMRIPVLCDTGLAYIHHGEPKSLSDFYRRVVWGANYESWFEHIKAGDFAQARRPQYLYGIVIAAEVASLGLSLLNPIGGWQIGVPASLGALAATIVLPSIKTAARHRAFHKLGDLLVMYGAYGLGTAAAMVGAGKRKALRWR